MEDDNLRALDEIRVQKLERNGSYIGILEEFDLLRVKITVANEYTMEEANTFRVLCKYLKRNAHSESLQIISKTLLKKLYAE